MPTLVCAARVTLSHASPDGHYCAGDTIDAIAVCDESDSPLVFIDCTHHTPITDLWDYSLQTRRGCFILTPQGA